VKKQREDQLVELDNVTDVVFPQLSQWLIELISTTKQLVQAVVKHPLESTQPSSCFWDL